MRGMPTTRFLSFVMFTLAAVSAVHDSAAHAGGNPSPLDKVQVQAIPPLERFDWQPRELVAVLGEHKGRQGGAVTSVAYSPNGKFLVSGSTNGYIRFWDPAAMRLQQVLGHGQGAYSLIFSKDNSVLVSGGGDGHARFWDVTGPKPKDKLQLKVSSTPLLCVALSPNAKLLAAGASDTRLSLWSLAEDPPMEVSTGDTHTGAVHAVVFLPDGKTVISGSADKSIRIWTIDKNRYKEKAVLPEAHAGAVLSLAVNPRDDKVLASGGADGTIRLWNLGVKPAPRGQVKGKYGVHALTWSPSGKTLVSAAADGTVRTWSVVGSVLTEKSVLEGHIDAATAVAFAPDSSTIVSGSHDWTVRQWPAVSGPKPKDKTVKEGHLSHVYSLAFSPDGTMLASGGYDRAVRLWDLPLAGPKEKTPSLKADAAVYKVAFAPDSKHVAAGGASAIFRTYDVAARRFVFAFQGHAGQLTGLAYSSDGVHLATSSNDKTARLWNAKTGKEVHPFTDFETYVNGVAFSPDGKRLLCSSGYYLYDKFGKLVTKDGVPVYLDSTVRLYDVESRKEMFRWKDEKTLISTINFTPDGKNLLGGGSDSALRLWSLPEVEPRILAKGAGGIASVTIAPDGTRAATFGPDYRVCLWELPSGKKLRDWVLHEQFGNVAFAPDSRHLAISLGTGVIYVLRLDEAKK